MYNYYIITHNIIGVFFESDGRHMLFIYHIFSIDPTAVNTCVYKYMATQIQ